MADYCRIMFVSVLWGAMLGILVGMLLLADPTGRVVLEISVPLAIWGGFIGSICGLIVTNRISTGRGSIGRALALNAILLTTSIGAIFGWLAGGIWGANLTELELSRMRDLTIGPHKDWEPTELAKMSLRNVGAFGGASGAMLFSVLIVALNCRRKNGIESETGQNSSARRRLAKRDWQNSGTMAWPLAESTSAACTEFRACKALFPDPTHTESSSRSPWPESSPT